MWKYYIMCTGEPVSHSLSPIPNIHTTGSSTFDTPLWAHSHGPTYPLHPTHLGQRGPCALAAQTNYKRTRTYTCTYRIMCRRAMNSNSLHVHILFDGAQGRCFRMRSGRRSVLPHASETEGIWDRKMDTGYGGENSMEGGSHSANRQAAAAADAAAAAGVPIQSCLVSGYKRHHLEHLPSPVCLM